VFTDGHIMGYSVTTETSKMVEESRIAGAALEVKVVLDQAPAEWMKDVSKQIHDVHEETG
jgi:hypothetical protein